MESIPRLKESQVGILFQLAGMAADSELPDDMGTLLYGINQAAYDAVEKEYGKLPGAVFLEQGVEFTAYEPCQFDGMNIDFHGKLTWGIYFGSSRAFTPEQLAALKALCTRKFEEAAKAAGVSCAYAGMKTYDSYEYSEEKDLEVAP